MKTEVAVGAALLSTIGMCLPNEAKVKEEAAKAAVASTCDARSTRGINRCIVGENLLSVLLLWHPSFRTDRNEAVLGCV